MIRKRKALIYVILFSLFWALDVVLQKYVFSNGAQLFSYSYQMFFIAFVLFVVCVSIKKKYSFTRKDVIYMFAVGAVIASIAKILAATGINLSLASNYGFIIKTAVVFVVIFSYFWLKEKVTWKKIGMLVLLMFGAYLISTRGEGYSPLLGDIFTLGAAAALACASVLSKKLMHRNSAEYFSLFRSVGSALSLFVLSLLIYQDPVQVEFIPFSLLGGILAFFTILFLYKTLEVASVTYLSMMSMMFSVMVAVLSFFLLGEVMNSVQMLGGAIIIGSVVMIEKFRL